MAVSPFLPSLAELKDAQPCKTRQCTWTKNPKKDSPPQQCSRLIADDGKTQGFLGLLHSSKDVRGVLENLSELQLCGRTHRAKCRELVLDEWIKEIREKGSKPATPPLSTKQVTASQSVASTTEARSQPLIPTDKCQSSIASTQRNIPKVVITSSILREILQNDKGDEVKCHGITTKGKRCTRQLARDSLVSIATILESLASNCGLPSQQQEVKRLLKELSCLVLCPKNHQDQASEKFEQWLKQVESIANPTVEAAVDSDRDVAEPPTTPKRQLRPRSSLSKLESSGSSPESSVSSIWSRSPRSQFNTPDTSPRAPTSRALHENSPLSPKTGPAHLIRPPLDDTNIDSFTLDSQPAIKLERQLFRPPIPTRRSTLRSHYVEPVQETISKFFPFQSQSPQKMLTALSEAIQRPLSILDQRLGYIYGFQREGSEYIKVGVSKDVKKRMIQWSNSCHYEPKVVLQVAVPYAFRIERLIQLHLRKERRRESLVAGRCNSGRGCEKAHKEWFDIRLDRLKEIVNIWARFGAYEPYDEKHWLKSIWVEKLKRIDILSRLDPWRHWVGDGDGLSSETAVVSVKSETKHKLEVRVEVSEIQAEDESDADADRDDDNDWDRREDVRIAQRGYRMRIKLEEGATKYDRSKGLVTTMLDATLGSGVVSLVASTVTDGVFD